ncbi:MAG TPA: AVAST type 2 anti-phage system protein Avs2 [Thermoanaerobaculia bacterium]|nr:AVAST type 2 anti-phage system protein Avs2 [Thermoanaerobaculia bacterium]
MTINWVALRPFNGSQQTAFEELCCQLARGEDYPAGSTPIRKGTPDAGVEFFWIMPDGDEHVWQAKFFLSRPSSTQWGEIEKSIKAALDKHPRLTRYVVCLPIDRADPRITGKKGQKQKWFMDDWDAHVVTWTTWAADRGMTVDFDYWGESEIMDRLAQERHAGRHFFWFNEKFFSNKWFFERYEEARAAAGARYTPELNVELPISRVFDSLGRTESFFQSFQRLRGLLRKEARSMDLAGDGAIHKSLDTLIELMSFFDQRDMTAPIPFAAIQQRCREAAELIAAEREKYDAGGGDLDSRERRSYIVHRLNLVSRALRDIREASASPDASAANINALLVDGEAGSGKTHLFCDVAQRRLDAGLPTVLLMGQQFGAGLPWPQITSMLHVAVTAEEFLGALNAAAEARNARAVILIDALNESDDRSMWRKHLASMLTLIGRYAYLSVAFSVRTSYTEDVIPEGLGSDKLIAVRHEGFEGHEYRATRTFFAAYGIVRPAVPLLNPEFDNPLFLKLFCQGIKAAGLTKVPPGFQGITRVFDFFTNSINEKLAREIDFDAKERLVQRALDSAAAAMAKNGRRWLLLAEAKAAVDAWLPNRSFRNSLFKHLLSEGLLAEEKVWSEDGRVDAVRFTYERFADHSITAHLLSTVDNSDLLRAAFAETTPLRRMLRTRHAAGVLEALAVQLPERFAVELPEMLPEHRLVPAVRRAFVQSLLWRRRDTVTRRTGRYLREIWWKHREDAGDVINAFLTVCTDPDHQFNARFLHRHLSRMKMPDRDRWWSTVISTEWGRHRAADRLIEWSWSLADEKSHIHDKPIELAATALGWLLTSPNRPLRDRATKALVALLLPRPAVLRAFLRSFAAVDDPYVMERVYCVAYGCAMGLNDTSALAELAQQVFSAVFEDGRPHPHVLLRDYARGVIEMALHRGAAINIEVQRARPPYASDPPTKYPSKEDIEKYKGGKGIGAIRLSVGEHGDFGRYIIGSNNQTFPFDDAPLNSRDVRRDIADFLKSLAPEETELRQQYERAETVRVIVQIQRDRVIQTTDTKLDEEVLAFRERFLTALGEERAAFYTNVVRPHQADSRLRQPTFDLYAAQRWVFQRVLDLGWTEERFAEFDQELYRGLDRLEGDRPERMGKKYQWIAWHEFVARVADNFRFYDQHDEKRTVYVGPWQMRLRDIDPSLLIARTGPQLLDRSPAEWWCPRMYDDWRTPEDQAEWVQSTADIPDPRDLIDITARDGARWLNLQMAVQWTEPALPGEDKWDVDHRAMEYDIRSYIIHRDAAAALWDWASARHHADTRISDMPTNHRIFLGEYYWAAAYEYFQTPYHGNDGWVLRGDPPQKLLRSSEGYTWERGDPDASIDERMDVILPARVLADGMELRHGSVPGTLVDASGTIVFQDPSVTATGPGALLGAREALLWFLEKHEYQLLWVVSGKRQAYPGGHDSAAGTPLFLTGVFRLVDDKLEGQFQARDTEQHDHGPAPDEEWEVEIDGPTS